MPGESLSLSERVQIEVDVAAGDLNEVIAAGLGRAPSTVRREFARNGGRAGYQAVAGHARAQRCRARPKAFALSQPGLAHHVETRLRKLDSPMTIAVELGRGLWGPQGTVSQETIYRAIYSHGRRGLPAGLSGCLHRRRWRRRHRPLDAAAPTKRARWASSTSSSPGPPPPSPAAKSVTLRAI